MRKFIYATGAAFAALVFVIGLVSAGPFRAGASGSVCGPNGCGPAVMQQPTAVFWEWKPSELPNSQHRIVLWRNGVYQGFWDTSGGGFCPYLGNDNWGAWTVSPPHPLPASILRMKAEALPAMQPVREWQMHGVDTERIDGQVEDRFTLNGRVITAQQAEKKLIDDDSGKLWLIVNGEGRERVIKDIQADPNFTDLLKRSRVWSVPADHFSLLDRETKKPMWSNVGNPSICLMTADRTILYEQDGYNGPEDLERLRKADPELKRPLIGPKKKDPPKPDDNFGLPNSTPLAPLVPVVMGLGAMGAFLYSRKGSL